MKTKFIFTIVFTIVFTLLFISIYKYNSYSKNKGMNLEAYQINNFPIVLKSVEKRPIKIYKFGKIKLGGGQVEEGVGIPGAQDAAVFTELLTRAAAMDPPLSPNDLSS